MTKVQVFVNRCLRQILGVRWYGGTEKCGAVENYIPGANRTTDQETQVALAWTHVNETSRERHTKRGTEDTPREAKIWTAEDHLVALSSSRSEGRWLDVGTAQAEGPGQEGIANSGGRPMFRTERQEPMNDAKVAPLTGL